MISFLEASIDFLLGKRKISLSPSKATEEAAIQRFPILVWLLAQIWLFIASFWKSDNRRVRAVSDHAYEQFDFVLSPKEHIQSLKSCATNSYHKKASALQKWYDDLPSFPSWENILDYLLADEDEISEGGDEVVELPATAISRRKSAGAKKRKNKRSSDSEATRSSSMDNPMVRSVVATAKTAARNVVALHKTLTEGAPKLKPSAHPENGPSPRHGNWLDASASPGASEFSETDSVGDVQCKLPGVTYNFQDVGLIQKCIKVLDHLAVLAIPFTPANMATVFDSPTIPSLSIQAYARRIVKYFGCSVQCFPLALMYIDRMTSYTGIQISRNNLHRLFLSSLSCAIKFMDDNYFSNEYYAVAGGCDAKEFNMMERHFLRAIRWKLHFTCDEYQHYVEIAHSCSEHVGA